MLRIVFALIFLTIDPVTAGAEPYGNCNAEELRIRRLENVVQLVCERVQGLHPTVSPVTVLIERFPGTDQYDDQDITARVIVSPRSSFGSSGYGKNLRPFLFDGRRVEYAIRDITSDGKPEIIFATIDFSGVEFLVVLSLRSGPQGQLRFENLRPFVEAEGRRVPEDAEDSTYVIKDGVNSAHVKSDGTIEIVRHRDPVNPNSPLERRLYRFINGEFVRQSVTPVPRAGR